jgi:hypothetical protein
MEKTRSIKALAQKIGNSLYDSVFGNPITTIVGITYLIPCYLLYKGSMTLEVFSATSGLWGVFIGSLAMDGNKKN